MSTIDERIAKKMEAVEQLKRQRKARESREKKKQEAIDKDRQRLIGKIFSEFFPCVLRLRPSRVSADNQIEFAPLTDFLSALAADKELAARLNEMINQHAASNNQQGSEVYPPSDV
jgi:hypothetical protein